MEQYTHTLRLESKLSDLRVGYANLFVRKTKKQDLQNFRGARTRLEAADATQNKREIVARTISLLLVELI